MTDFNTAIKNAEDKSSFNDLMNKAKGLPEKPALVGIPLKPLFEYKVEDEYLEEKFPQHYLKKPDIGETVMAESGAILKITNITHLPKGRLLITLSRDMGGSTPMEGAGSNMSPF